MSAFYSSGNTLVALVLLVGCAEKAKVSPRAAGAGKNVAAANGREKTDETDQQSQAAEQALWTVANTPIKHECQPPAEMGFYPSKGLTSNNRYMLSRFAAIGGASFRFEESYLQSFFKSAEFAGVKVFEDKGKGVQGFVATSEKVNLVVFRGTHSAGGMVTDMNFLLAGNGMQGGVHRGFKAAFDAVKPAINAALDAQNRPEIPTYYIGHSLGGALAMLAAADGIAGKVKVEGVVTLGQPRTGNATFSENFSKLLGEKYFRFVHARDLVPHLPPSSGAADAAANAFSQNSLVKLAVQGTKLLGFSHVGQLVHFDMTGLLLSPPASDGAWDSNYWVSNAETVQQTVTSLPSLAGSGASLKSLAQNNLIGDHDLEKYLCQILKNAK
ncbi:MAG: hypothetical protein RL189_3037 [Pseudomonadota bacterium]|jgi:hypothetical protein